MAQLNFSTEGIDTSNDFDVLPAGNYTVMVADSQMVNTKTGGEMLKITLNVLDGPAAGRVLWDNLNLINQNSKAVEIANRQLAKLCLACGLKAIRDSSELHNIPIVAKVCIEPPKNGYEATNRVKDYLPVGSAKPATSARPATAAATSNATAQPQSAPHTPPPTDEDVPPWAR